MFKINKIEKPKIYVDKSIKLMEEFAIKQRGEISKRFEKTVSTFKKDKETNNLNKRKDLELEKIRFLNNDLNNRIKKIIKTFPNFKILDEVYLKLLNTSNHKVPEVTDALARLLWISNMIDDFSQNFEHRIKKSSNQKSIGFMMGKYLGKINSLFRKNKSYFEILEHTRIFMNKLPKFENLYTISIAGFPNVGKSTLMKKITGSDVEIQNYPFTTKGLMFGYIKENNNKIIQLIDTPGLLNRENKENHIELKAKVIISDYSQSIIFILDLTETSGFSIEQQLKLLKETSQKNSNIIVYFSKVDIYNEETIEIKNDLGKKLKKYKQFSDSNKIKEFLISKYKSNLNKFDPKKLKSIK